MLAGSVTLFKACLAGTARGNKLTVLYSTVQGGKCDRGCEPTEDKMLILMVLKSPSCFRIVKQSSSGNLGERGSGSCHEQSWR